VAEEREVGSEESIFLVIIGKRYVEERSDELSFLDRQYTATSLQPSLQPSPLVQCSPASSFSLLFSASEAEGSGVSEDSVVDDS